MSEPLKTVIKFSVFILLCVLRILITLNNAILPVFRPFAGSERRYFKDEAKARAYALEMNKKEQEAEKK